MFMFIYQLKCGFFCLASHLRKNKEFWISSLGRQAAKQCNSTTIGTWSHQSTKENDHGMSFIFYLSSTNPENLSKFWQICIIDTAPPSESHSSVLTPQRNTFRHAFVNGALSWAFSYVRLVRGDMANSDCFDACGTGIRLFTSR